MILCTALLFTQSLLLFPWNTFSTENYDAIIQNYALNERMGCWASIIVKMFKFTLKMITEEETGGILHFISEPPYWICINRFGNLHLYTEYEFKRGSSCHVSFPFHTTTREKYVVINCVALRTLCFQLEIITPLHGKK